MFQNYFFPKTFFLFLLLLFSGNLQADSYFEFTPKAEAAYDKAMSLRFDEARRLLYQIRYEEPDNQIVHLIENYIDFFSIFINENKQEFKQLAKNKDYRLLQIRDGDQDSPYYLYSQAEIRLQWALARLKFEEYFTAFNEVKTAYRQLKKNERKFPDFIANKKSLGIIHALIGTIPDNYKWGVKILGGMTGTIEQGRKEIQTVLDYAKQQDFIFEEETVVMYAFLLLHLKNQDDAAWDIIHSGALRSEDNPLACFVLANVAMRTGKNDEAIELLKKRPRGKEFMDFPYLDFMLGTAKLNRLDPDAPQFFRRYISRFRGRNYLKQSYQKIAWHYLLQGDEASYKKNIKRIELIGAEVIDGDVNASKEAESGEVPNADLLRARVLFDGGYYKRAYEVLNAKKVGDFSSKHFQLEYHYRLGRIAHKMERTAEALNYYQKTIDEGSDEPWFYACNAALQMGLIHEASGQNTQAKKYFEACLDIYPEEYRNSLHQKAKAGLNRL